MAQSFAEARSLWRVDRRRCLWCSPGRNVNWIHHGRHQDM